MLFYENVLLNLKAGKAFDAALKFDENYRAVFDFPQKKPNNRKK
jgi:hypothetical protein